jgi:hypothetical protein
MMTNQQHAISEKIHSEAGDTYNYVNRQIQQFEEAFDPLQHEFDGWCVWPLLRWSVGIGLTQQNMSEPFKKPRRPSRMLMIRAALRDLARSVRMPRARYALMVRSSNRSEKQGDMYEDIFFDQLLLKIGPHFKIEQINNGDHFRAGRSELLPSHMTTVAVAGLAQALSRLGPRTPHMRTIARTLSDQLVHNLSLTTFTPQFIENTMRDFYWRKRWYRWLFRQMQPDLFLLTVSYASHASIAAAKEQGIRVIEMQHGIGYMGYSWTAYAAPYKSRMPIPDRIWVYGAYWQQILIDSGFWEHNDLRLVGAPRMDRYRAQYTDTPRQQDVMTLLFTSQGFDTPKVIAFLAEFARLAEGRLNFQLYIKLHPIYEHDKQPYLDAFQPYPHVHVLHGREKPTTFELLARAHVHISITSTCHYEALAFGISTIVLPFVSEKTVQSLCDYGYAEVAYTPAELLEKVLHEDRQEPDPAIGNTFFQYGAVEAMQRELHAELDAAP